MGIKSQLTEPLLAMPRPLKRLLAVAVDVLLIVFTVWVALCVRLDEWVRLEPKHFIYMLAGAAIVLPLFTKFGLYHAIFRYTGWNALMTIAQASALYGFIYMVIFTVIGVPGLIRSVGVLHPVLFFLGVSASRVAVGMWFGDDRRFGQINAMLPGVLIYGAGSTGRQLLAALDQGRRYRILGFLDDEKGLQGNRIDGRVVYSPRSLKRLVARLEVNEIWLAMPSLGRQRRNEVLNRLTGFGVYVRTVPSMGDLISGRVQTTDVRELDIEDLLGRDPVRPDPDLMNLHIAGKTVLVTGAGGSIGSELCRQIMVCKPQRLLLLDQSEFALYQIHSELAAIDQTQTDIVPLLASVRDSVALSRIFSAWHPHTVYHAAAYKHVPLVEHNVAQGLFNNIWGTRECALQAAAAGVQNFVLISTDKAVRPTNVMGASKRIAEMVLQALALQNQNMGQGCTNFSMVRFGNVLGSSGSVVPLFRQQIQNGGPITLTHRDITRYFMTIPEAAQLVIQAGAMAKGGDVFVLDMGDPVKIYDLAKRMIELSGLALRDAENPAGDIEISLTGLRPGEKLYEELLIGENPETTQHPRIMKAHEKLLEWQKLESALSDLQSALGAMNLPKVIELLHSLVDGYQNTEGVVDFIYLNQTKAP